MEQVFHVVVNSLNPAVGGGMAESAARLISTLTSLGRNLVRVYCRHGSDGWRPDGANVEVLDLVARGADILRALPRDERVRAERYRAEGLLLKEDIALSRRQYPGSRQAIISFYATSNGFLAQRVAMELGVPHIACVRGTDFSRDSYDTQRVAALEFVAKHADRLVATNQMQAAYLRRISGRSGVVHTIYNALPRGLPSTWWAGRSTIRASFVADCGFSFKKGTHILLDAAKRLFTAGVPAHFTVVGADEAGMGAFWQAERARCIEVAPDGFRFECWMPKRELEGLLLAGDAYATASLGEGCSNASLYALALGMPLVATDCGALADLARELAHVRLVSPGDVAGLVAGLSGIQAELRAGQLSVDRAAIVALRERLSPDVERREWERAIAAAVPRACSVAKTTRPRVLLYVHDGTGLGHLRRMSRIAGALQGPCSCLLVTGHRAASWMVPESCEYAHVPSLDSLIPSKAAYWGRDPFLDLSRDQVAPFRAQMIESVVEAFRPDAIIVDYLPLGKYDELEGVVRRHPARKYLVLRGVLDHPANVRIDILDGKAEQLVEEFFSRVFVACDPLVCDVVAEYGLSDILARKTSYVGYISDPVPRGERERARQARVLPPDGIWVVCSAGGGRLGERLVEECTLLSRVCPREWTLDVVAGPKSRLGGHGEEVPWMEGRHRFWHEARGLPLLHAAADVVVCPGSYNSIVEAMEGGARLVCAPVQLDMNDEQYIHPQRLKEHYPLWVVTSLHEVPRILEDAVAHCRSAAKPDARERLDLNGQATLRRLLLHELT